MFVLPSIDRLPLESAIRSRCRRSMLPRRESESEDRAQGLVRKREADADRPTESCLARSQDDRYRGAASPGTAQDSRLPPRGSRDHGICRTLTGYWFRSFRRKEKRPEEQQQMRSSDMTDQVL